MPLVIPSRSDVVSATQGYVRESLPDLDPSTSRRSFIGGLVKSLSSALHDWYVALKRYADNEPFPQRASADFLKGGWWVDVTKLEPNEASPASGQVVLTGTNGTIIPAGTEMVGNNFVFRVEETTAIVAQSLACASLTRSGTTAIFETVGEHLMASGMSVTVSGATQTDYNGTFAITVTAANEFTYTVSNSPAAPATGTPVAAATYAVARVVCDDTGQTTNIDAGSTLSVQSPPSGCDSTAIVTFGALGNGADVEDIEDYRLRVLKALGTDFGMFTADEIEIVAKTVPGVTRVWVLKATLGGTNGVNEGQVKIAFMRDDDANPFPSASEVALVKSTIVDLILPAHTAAEDVIVQAPTRLAVDIEIDALAPDTPSMRRAVIARLEQFFGEGVDYATNVSVDAIKCAIFETYDRERRQKITSFTLADPSATVTVSSDELPALGEVTFT